VDDANVCTIARAEAVATHGDTVQVRCGLYDLGSTALTVNANVTIRPDRALCAEITGGGATATVILAAQNDANVLTFGAFVVTPTGSASRAISISAMSGYDATVVIEGTKPYTGTNSAINDASLRGTTKILDVIADGTIGAQGWITAFNQASVAAKKILVDGCSGSLTATAANTPAVTLTRTTTAPAAMWAAIRHCNLEITVPVALGASALGRGLNISNATSAPNLDGVVEPPVIEDSTISITATAVTGGDSLGISCTATNSAAIADYMIMRNNTVFLNTPAAFGVTAGDGATLSYCNYNEIYGNTVTNTYYDGTSTPHGIRLGRVTGGHAWGNTVNGGAVCLIASINQGGLFTGNLCRGPYYAGAFAKGNGATTAPIFSNNTIILDDRLYGVKIGAYGCLGAAVQGATANTAAWFFNNLCVVQSGTGWKYAVVDASQIADFDRNAYHSDVSLTEPWSYQEVTYEAVADWNANPRVLADLAGDPLFMSTTRPDYRLSASSPYRRGGIAWGTRCKDIRGRACWSQPDIGAYQATAGDAAGARSAR
jgi:hypothetical protein